MYTEQTYTYKAVQDCHIRADVYSSGTSSLLDATEAAMIYGRLGSVPENHLTVLYLQIGR
jgi:hypothetical protein